MKCALRGSSGRRLTSMISKEVRRSWAQYDRLSSSRARKSLRWKSWNGSSENKASASFDESLRSHHRWVWVSIVDDTDVNGRRSYRHRNTKRSVVSPTDSACVYTQRTKEETWSDWTQPQRIPTFFRWRRFSACVMRFNASSTSKAEICVLALG